VTAVLLITVYLIALTTFLGLDIVSRVPPTLYALVLAGLGALTAVSVVGAFHVGALPGGDPLAAGTAALAGMSAGGGLVVVGRLLRASGRKAK
jgi:NAD(P) transhydrogenase subunit alpha